MDYYGILIPLNPYQNWIDDYAPTWVDNPTCDRGANDVYDTNAIDSSPGKCFDQSPSSWLGRPCKRAVLLTPNPKGTDVFCADFPTWISVWGRGDVIAFLGTCTHVMLRYIDAMLQMGWAGLGWGCLGTCTLA